MFAGNVNVFYHQLKLHELQNEKDHTLQLYLPKCDIVTILSVILTIFM